MHMRAPLAEHERTARRWAWCGAALAVFLFSALWAQELSQPLYDDEIAFVRAAQVIMQPDPTRYIIPHPPLVIHLMAAADALLPWDTDDAMRVPAWLAGVATILLLPYAGRVLLPADTDEARAEGWLTGGLAALCYAVAPLAVQSAGLLDIDNSWLTPFTFAPFVLAALSAQATTPRARTLLLVGEACTLALAYWTKLLTTPFVSLARGAHALAARDWRALQEGVLVAVASLVLFAITLAVYVPLMAYPLEQYAVTFSKGGEIGGLGVMARRALQGGGIQLFWLGVPWCVLWVWESARAVVRLVRGRPLPVDGLVLFAWLVFGSYLVIRELPYGFPRYQMPLMPAFTLLCAWPLARALVAGGRRVALGAAGAVGAALAYGLLVVGDPLLAQYRLTFETTVLSTRVLGGASGLLLAVPVPLALAGACLWLAQRGTAAASASRGATWALLSACALSCAGLGGGLATSLAQARADYALRYNYGRTGVWEAVALMRAPDAPTGTAIAPAELLYYAERTGVLHYQFFCPQCTPAPLLAELAHAPAFIALTEKEARRYVQVSADPAVVAHLQACYRLQVVGSYHVYTRTCAPQVQAP